MPHTGPILVIDQDRTIAALFVELLTDAGFFASTVYDRSDALAVAVMVPPAMIVLDVGHSISSGAALINRIRAAGLARTPVVVTTTNAVAAASLLDVPGVVACLAKPFDPHDMLDCVARYVQPQTAEPRMHSA